MSQQHFNILTQKWESNTNEIVKQATENKDAIEKSAQHVSNLFQNNTFTNEERDELMQMLLKLNVMSIRQVKIINKTLRIGCDYL